MPLQIAAIALTAKIEGSTDNHPLNSNWAGDLLLWLGLRPQKMTAEQIPPRYSRVEENTRSLYARTEW